MVLRVGDHALPQVLRQSRSVIGLSPFGYASRRVGESKAFDIHDTPTI